MTELDEKIKEINTQIGGEEKEITGYANIFKMALPQYLNWGMHLTQPPPTGCVILISLYVAGSVITAC